MRCLSKSLLTVAAVGAFAAAVIAQKQQTAEAIVAAGMFSGQEYRNPALGFSILAPGGWRFYNAEQNQDAIDRNKRAAFQARDAILETSAANTQVLFQAIPPKFAGQDKQAILSAGIEKLTAQTTLATYAADQKALVLGGANAHLTRDLYKVTYGGGPFVEFDVEGSREAERYRQRYLITIRRGVALFIVATFFDDRQSGIVDAALRSVTFK